LVGVRADRSDVEMYECGAGMVGLMTRELRKILASVDSYGIIALVLSRAGRGRLDIY